MGCWAYYYKRRDEMVKHKELNSQQWLTQEFCSEGVQQIQLRTEDRENGDLGVVAP